MKRRVTVILLVLIVMLVGMEVVVAKEPGVISINGPGIETEIVIPPNSGQEREMLELMFMRDTTKAIVEPEGLEPGYTLTMILFEEKDVLELRIDYYPTVTGDGYLYFPHDAGPEYPAGWYRTRKGVQAEFAALLAAYDVTMVVAHAGGVSPTVDAASGSNQVDVPVPTLLWLLAGTLIVVLTIGAWQIARLPARSKGGDEVVGEPQKALE